MDIFFKCVISVYVFDGMELYNWLFCLNEKLYMLS